MKRCVFWGAVLTYLALISPNLPILRCPGFGWQICPCVFSPARFVGSTCALPTLSLTSRRCGGSQHGARPTAAPWGTMALYLDSLAVAPRQALHQHQKRVRPLQFRRAPLAKQAAAWRGEGKVVSANGAHLLREGQSFPCTGRHPHRRAWRAEPRSHASSSHSR